MICIDLREALKEAAVLAKEKEIPLTLAYRDKFVLPKIATATAHTSLVFETMIKIKGCAVILENEMGISQTIDISSYALDFTRRVNRYIANLELDYINDKSKFSERLNEVEQDFADVMELAFQMQYVFHAIEAISRTVNPVFFKNDEKIATAFLTLREAIRLFDILISELVLLKTYLYRISPSQKYNHTNFTVLENEK